MRGKKGLIYSLLTILLLAPSILLIVTYLGTIGMEGQNFSNKVRADSMNNFYNSLMTDLERSLKISTQRAILYATQIISTTGQPFCDKPDKSCDPGDSEARLSEMIWRGTLDGEDVPSLQAGVGSPCNTIDCWSESYEDVAADSGYELSLEIKSVSVSPYDSWDLNSSAEIKLDLKDKGTGMNLKRTVTQSSKVSIIGFEDPIYTIKTLGKFTQLIKVSTKDPLTKADSGSGWAVGSIETASDQANPGKVLLTDSTMPPAGFGGVLFKESVSETPSIPFLSNLLNEDPLVQGRKVFFESITNSVWDLQEEKNSQNYHESDYGPSYLDRLEGRLYISDELKSQSSNSIGLLSFIDFSKLEAKGTQVDTTKTCVDYLYFSGQSDGTC